MSVESLENRLGDTDAWLKSMGMPGLVIEFGIKLDGPACVASPDSGGLGDGSLASRKGHRLAQVQSLGVDSTSVAGQWGAAE
jgi:hypothetical protein